MELRSTLVLSAALALVACLAYGAVAVVVWRREVARENRWGSRLFAIWWASVGVNRGLTGIATLAAAWDVTDLALYVTHAYLERLVLSVGLWALAAHLAFLVTGTRRSWVGLGIFHAAYYLFLLHRLAAATPTGLQVEAWARPKLAMAEPDAPWVFPLVVLVLLAAPVTAAATYLWLSIRSASVPHRLRIAAVALGILLWVALSVTAYAAADSAPVQIANRLAGVLVPLTLLYALAAHRNRAPAVAPAAQGA